MYFAAHGVALPDDALNGFLALAGGRWTAKDIQLQCLHQAELAVLSACQTGLGHAHDAGMIGIARAFHIAGVEKVVMSLWNVDDEATRDLMVGFMQRRENTNVAQALRLAMLAARTQRPEPKYWAGFTVFGIPQER